MKLLVAYGTTEGHTRTIALRITEWVRAQGIEADVIDTATVPDSPEIDRYDAYILTGSLHMSKHQASLVHFVKEHLWAINDKPNAFISASLSAVISDDVHMHDANVCIEAFLNDTGLIPTASCPVAGALLYTKYDWLKRMLMRMISKSQGGDLDMSQDFEYTNWEALKDFVDDFVESKVRVRHPSLVP